MQCSEWAIRLCLSARLAVSCARGLAWHCCCNAAAPSVFNYCCGLVAMQLCECCSLRPRLFVLPAGFVTQASRNPYEASLAVWARHLPGASSGTAPKKRTATVGRVGLNKPCEDLRKAGHGLEHRQRPSRRRRLRATIPGVPNFSCWAAGVSAKEIASH